MTAIRSAPPLRARSVHAATGALRARGHRVSTARRLVLESLYAAGGPVSAEQIASGLEGHLPASDLASVYRNLEVLERLGLVHHVHPGHGPGRYALAAREYLFCERCGALQTAGSAQFDTVRDLVRDAFGYEASFTHFPLVGLCPSCRGGLADHESAA
ncbi:MAG TPA: transcriptional repressor [Solirubrobacteraceae bacterium]|nr:transcriptional repressor [Solirubrobacteraceae bacterium]